MAVTSKDVLIIDDDSEVRLLMRKMLEGIGANVLEQNSVEGALQYAMASPPHLMLLDLKMPKHSGFDFLTARNKSPVLNKVPVVVVSGSRDKDSIYRAISLGAADYVVKPLHTKTILQKVRKYLKDASFFSYEFAEGEQQKANVHLSGSITAFNKTHFKLEAPVKILPNTTLPVQAPFLASIGCEEKATKTANTPARYLENKRFQNTIQMVGLNMDEIKLVKEAVKKSS